MLQWLLAERFGLVVHGETRSLPSLALLVAKNGPKIKPAAPDSDAPAQPAPGRLEKAGRTLDALWSPDPREFGVTAFSATAGNLHAEFARLPMDALAQILASNLNMPVLNATGLEGRYRVTLDLPLPGAPASDEGASPSAQSAVKRFGLKLEPRKAPIAVLVVDRVEWAPTEN
jgi:uncharacterized protein (TIGR03435 family)